MKPKRSVFVVSFCLFLMVGLSWEVGAYDEFDLNDLLKNKECQKCDLTNAFLKGANLTGADLTGVNLQNAKLAGTDLRDANLMNANFHMARFCNTTMPDGSKENSDCGNDEGGS